MIQNMGQRELARQILKWSVLILTVVGCNTVGTPSARFQNGLPSEPEVLSISIEDQADGNGSVPSFTAVTADTTQTLFAIIRNSNGDFIGNLAVDWTISSNIGTFTGPSVGTSVTDSTFVTIDFTGDGRTSNTVDSGVISATSSQFNSFSISATVVAGAAVSIAIENASDGSGIEIPAQTINAGQALTLFAVSRDFDSNVVGLESVTWSQSVPEIGSFTTTAAATSNIITASIVGTATVTGSSGAFASASTGLITVVAGAATQVSGETTVDGTGGKVTTQTITVGDSLQLFAVTRDAFNNFVGVDSVQWSIASGLGTFSPSNDGGITGFGTAATLTTSAIGENPIFLDHATLSDDTTAVITVTNNVPVVASSQAFIVTLGATSFPITVDAGTDIDVNHTISYQQVSAPTSGTFDNCMDLAGSTGVTDRTCTYTPTGTFSGPVNFIYKANDGFQDSVANATISILVVSNSWTWENSAAGPANTNVVSQPGTYGVTGTASTANVPGGRQGAVSWVDSDNNFWLFGGEGFGNTTITQGALNDLWRFNPTTKAWTHMSGTTVTFGGMILSSARLGGAASDTEVTPAARRDATGWVVNNGASDDDLYMFGGIGPVAATGHIQLINNALENGDQIIINDVSFTARAAAPIANEFVASDTLANTAIEMARSINSSITPSITGVVTAFADGTNPFVILYSDIVSATLGNALTLTETDNATENFNLSGATLSGGLDTSTTTGFFNDLWKYNTANNSWTLVQSGIGAPTLNHFPIHNQGPTFIGNPSFPNTGQDSAGDFGVLVTAATTNVPSTRARAAGDGWVVTGANPELWMMGGQGLDSAGDFGVLNDMWRFDVNTNLWTYMRGDNLINSGGTYGTTGTAAITNQPGGRHGAGTGKDSSGNFVLFGGEGFPSSGGSGLLNDLWKYSPTDDTWVHLSGDSTRNSLGVYGLVLVTSTTAKPGGRLNSNVFVTSDDRVWVYGGFGRASVLGPSFLDDLFMYDGTNWTFMKGNDAIDQAGAYATQNVEDAISRPGGRANGSVFIDSNQDFWIFGGEGFGGTAGQQGTLQDIWRYNP